MPMVRGSKVLVCNNNNQSDGCSMRAYSSSVTHNSLRNNKVEYLLSSISVFVSVINIDITSIVFNSIQ